MNPRDYVSVMVIIIATNGVSFTGYLCRSNPFNIQDLGKVYVKLDKVEGASDLVKVNIVINEATIRAQITAVKDQGLWPYQIRNLTDKTITFYQKVYVVGMY